MAMKSMQRKQGEIKWRWDEIVWKCLGGEETLEMEVKIGERNEQKELMM
jgi:hypothetical protein